MSRYKMGVGLGDGFSLPIHQHGQWRLKEPCSTFIALVGRVLVMGLLCKIQDGSEWIYLRSSNRYRKHRLTVPSALAVQFRPNGNKKNEASTKAVPLLSRSNSSLSRFSAASTSCFPGALPLQVNQKSTSSLPDEIKRHVSEGVGRHAQHCPAHPMSGVVPVMEQGEQTSKKEFCKWPGRLPVYIPCPHILPRTYCNNPHRGQYDIKYIVHTF